MEKDITTVIGSLNYDFLVKQERMPIKGETFLGDSIVMAPGGKGANQAAQCAKLGLQTYMVGKVGSDPFGDVILDSLRKERVNIDYVKKVQTNSGLGIVHILPDGDYYSTILRGANFSLTVEDVWAVEELLKKSKIAIFQQEIPIPVLEYAISLASKYGCYIMLNAAPPNEVAEGCFALVDCLIVNEIEAACLWNKEISSVKDAHAAARDLYQRIKQTVVITLGENGVVYYDGMESTHVLANKVNALDTTGAGDSFVGAFAYSIYHNKPLGEAIQFAVHTSSITVTKDGGQPSFPHLDEINQIV